MGVHVNSCAVQGCSGLSCVFLAAPHSHSSSTKLCAGSAKEWKEVKVERRGQHGSLCELCEGELQLYILWGFSLIFSLLYFCFTFWVCPVFISLSLSISFSIFSSVLLCTFTSFYILFLASPPYSPTFVKSFIFLLILEIFILFLYISSHISFLSPFS